MTQDEIIRMAREAELWGCEMAIGGEKELERFAALVAQNYMKKACGDCVIKQCYKRMDAEIEAAVLAEREACAKVCDDKHDYMCSRAAAAIRARSQTRGEK